MHNLGAATYSDDGWMVDKDGNYIDPLVTVDHKSDPSETVDAINELLDEHGLELVQYDSDDDEYVFSIRKLKPIGIKSRRQA